MMRALLCFSASVLAAGHGGLLLPPSRNNHGNVDPNDYTPLGPPRNGGPCAGGLCYWFNQGCYIGFANCTNIMPASGNVYGGLDVDPVLEPSLNDLQLRTWNLANLSGYGDWTRYHPWRAPGFAPVTDPCGVAAGYLDDGHYGGKTVPPGAKQGDLGSQLPPLDGVRTAWQAGGVAEVGWMLAITHGGGYLYSLCPKDADLSEACFQKTPLAFADKEHTIRYIDGSQADFRIAAVDVSEGTFPANSVWRRNPIPGCNCDFGTHCGQNASIPEWVPYEEPAHANHSQRCWSGTQFQPPFEDGFYDGVYTEGVENWMIVDRLRVPEVPGEYVLRWRWDVENHPQVWTNCADITVVAESLVV